MASISSTQITQKLLNSPDPKRAKFNLWKNTRYLISQREPVKVITRCGFYKGYVVVAGPKADARLMQPANVNDLDIMENQHFIRFTDNITTSDVDAHVAQALFTIMSNEDANHYEQLLLEAKKSGQKQIVHTEKAKQQLSDDQLAEMVGEQNTKMNKNVKSEINLEDEDL